MTYTAFPPFPRGGKSMCLPSPCIIVIPGFLVLMTIDAPVQVIMASLAVVLIVIELIPVFLYPACIRVFNPSIFVVEGMRFFLICLWQTLHAIFSSPLSLWHGIQVPKHIGNQVYGNCIARFDILVTLNARYLIFKMHLVGKF